MNTFPQPTDLCLVVPAFDTISFPPLGVSILAAACRARNLRVNTIYGSMRLAVLMGYEAYRTICNLNPREQSGEYLFRAFAYPQDVLQTLSDGPVPERNNELFEAAARYIEPHLNEVVAAIVATQPRIVGITSNFQQNMAAFAIARLVRQQLPNVVIAMGGANVTAPMSDGLAKIPSEIDYFFSGEADVEFPDFCAALLRENRYPAERIIRCTPVSDMTLVPAADFSDFEREMRMFQAAGQLPSSLPESLSLETSRGCWWGEKNHCTFCGLNGDGMYFRSKPPQRVIEEIRTIDTDWPGKRIQVTDNIMPRNFFADVLPHLAAFERRPRMFYEVKANLNENQLGLMWQAGVDRIQPGIESLSTNVLRLMRKGVSAGQNIALLRNCTARGFGVIWNLLYGFPGETAADYLAMIDIIPMIEHLHWPEGCFPIIIDRFSPYFEKAEQLGIGETKPWDSYRGLYPPGAPLQNIAYHFTGSYTTEFLRDPTLVEGFRAAVRGWKRKWPSGKTRIKLRGVETGKGKLAVVDTRTVAEENLTVLSPDAIDTLHYFDRPRTPADLPSHHAKHLDELLHRKFLLSHEGFLVNLVVMAPN